MGALIALLAVPIMILNFLGGIVGGIWLLVAGDWSTFGYGLLYLFGGTFAVSLLMLPAMALAFPAAKLAESGRDTLAFIVGIPALLWTYAVVIVSCVAVFSWIMLRADGSPWPYLLWAYAVATGPWSFMASKEEQGRNEYANMTAFASQLGVVSLFAAYLTDPSDVSFGRLVWWFAPLMVAALIVNMFMVWANVRSAQQHRAFRDF